MEFAPQKNAHIALHVEDVATARAELEEKGIEFIGETFDTGVCHMAFFNDPDGNDLMLHHRYSPRADEVERVDYIRVPVTDIEEANHFYGEVLGLQRNPNSSADDWVEYEAGNVTLAVMTPHTHEYEFTPLPPATIALRVRDVAAAQATLEAAGLEVAEMWDSGVCQWSGCE